MVLLKLSPWLNIWVTWVLQKLLSVLELIMLHSDSWFCFPAQKSLLIPRGTNWWHHSEIRFSDQVISSRSGGSLLAQSLPENFCDRQNVFWIWQTMCTNLCTRMSIWRKIYCWIDTEKMANKNHFCSQLSKSINKICTNLCVISKWRKYLTQPVLSLRQRQYFCSEAKDSWGTHDC